MMHKKKQRKYLSCSEETFFETVLLVYGPPDPEARNYINVQGPFQIQGIGPYLREHPRGKLFMQCVVTYGEAKVRAGKWYYRYIKWWYENTKENE